MDGTQEDAIRLVDNIGITLGLERHTDASGCSYYGVSNNTVIRVSDHSTHLQTWVDNNSISKQNLYSVVIETNPSKPDLRINKEESFSVTEFKHKLKQLNGTSYLELINAIKGAIGNGGQFSNPLKVKPKLLYPTYTPMVDANPNPREIEMANENVRTITESQLRNIICESIRKILFNSN